MKAEIVNSITGELRGPFFTIADAKDVPAAFEEAWAGVVAMLQYDLLEVEGDPDG